ncbi:unnamed protein product [Didymodactylos carnosus]|uniref:Xaa-Pro dipeptidyl-peptidase C-terminal domain-containing protein n=2 Tax=Didymodactylos carnosus TaxID=1234261 RepID=A0A8S2S7F1_9BILA|nr:unnamed protein product [Didymodactylos carnosus]CAF4209813.1 unnamed protein product [Didymodactylos carnosus]
MMSGNPSIRTEFPYDVQKFSQVSIPLLDNVKLAATLWVPNERHKSDLQSAQHGDESKFPAILEFLPYRKADWTSVRDELRLKYFSGFGYVSVRVDIRGTGNSEGIFDDEYSEQEQKDCGEVLDWISRQTWCTGKIVMFGKSWGGFNGLQMAALRPKNLAGVISAYSTDDRYSDDIHYCGGCIAAGEALSWSTQMLVWSACAPHPQYQGGLDVENDKWLIMWKKRLEDLDPLDSIWLKHQTRDNYWRHGSICEDYSQIQCPVLLIGGFSDLYTDPVFRMMSALTSCEKRAIIGPWGHQWSDSAYPGPQIGILQEFVRWMDHYIKGIDNGINHEPVLSIYQLHPNSDELHSVVEERKGEWLHINHVPAYENERDKRNKNALRRTNSIENQTMEQITLFLTSSYLLQSNSPSQPSSTLSFSSSQFTGMVGGNWLGWGTLIHPDHPVDQREDDGRSICFTAAEHLNEDLELFGFPSVRFDVSCDQPNALLCVRLCAIHPTRGASVLIARGILNLTHRDSHENPEPLQIGQVYSINITLSSTCVRIAAGYRLRLAVSTCYWPLVWPSAHPATVTLHFNTEHPPTVILPKLINKWCV